MLEENDNGEGLVQNIRFIKARTSTPVLITPTLLHNLIIIIKCICERACFALFGLICLSSCGQYIRTKGNKPEAMKGGLTK